jgi:hypothetical protein
MKRALTTVLPLLAVVAAVALVWFGNIGNDSYRGNEVVLPGLRV